MRLQKTIGWLLALTPLLALFSCESDTMPDSQQDELVPVTIRLGVEGSGLATRAADGGFVDVTESIDDDAISSLDVYIMNGSTVEQHLQWNDFENNIANDISLTTGQKHIYAVANYSGLTGTPPDNQSVNALTQISTTIPMSADTTWTVTNTENAQYEVRLNRMVAKMNVKIEDNRASATDGNGTISSFSIAGLLPANTNLYRQEYGQVELPSNVGELTTWTWDNPTIGEDGTTFYLHETTSTEGFKIELKTSDDEAKPRSAKVPLTIPRNFIQPLVIHITDYSLDISIKTYDAPIGVLPIERTQDSYNVKLPEGCTFEATITVKKNMTPNTWNSNASWDWTVDNNLENILVFDVEDGQTEPSWPSNAGISTTANASFSFSGRVSAVGKQNENCTISIVLTDGNVTQKFDDVVFTVEDLTGIGTTTGALTITRSTTEVQPIVVEL